MRVARIDYDIMCGRAEKAEARCADLQDETARKDAALDDMEAAIEEQQARCERLEASLKETVRVLAFAFEEGALPDETVMSLCIDPYGILNDARAALQHTTAETGDE